MSTSNDLVKRFAFVIFSILLFSEIGLAQRNLTPYQPAGWSDKIVVSTVTGTNTDSAGLSSADPLYIDWAVINNGTAATTVRFFTELYVDNVLRASWYTDPPLNANFYTYVPDHSLGTLAAGTHTIRIVTDSTGAIAETNESDNQYTKTITVTSGGSPNLTTYQPAGWSDKIVVSTVTGTNIDGTGLSSADTLYIDWAVLNSGTASTSVRFYTELYVDNVLSVSWYTDPPLNPSFYINVLDYSLGTLAAGTHTLRIVTDSTGAIGESNEADNQYTKTITVGSGGLNPALTTIGTTPKPPIKSQQFSFAFTGAGFDPGTAEVFFLGPGCATPASCVVPNGALTTKTATAVAGLATLADGNFTVQVRNAASGLVSNVKPLFVAAQAGTSAPRALVLLVDFPDEPGQTPRSYFEAMMFGNHPAQAPQGSFRDYFKEVSYGNFDVDGSVNNATIAWIRLPQNSTYYAGGCFGISSSAPPPCNAAYPQNAQRMVEDAVIAARNLGLDFGPFDANNDGSVDALFLIHAGQGGESTNNRNDIWSHAWLARTPVDTGSTNSAGQPVSVWRYTTEPEFLYVPGDMTMGVFAHEYGHSRWGLPDLYDIDYTSSGIGEWSLMAGGTWNGTPQGASPAHLDAWSKYFAGFVTPVQVTSTLLNEPITQAATSPDVYQLLSGSPAAHTGEYFLIENRQRTGFDSGLPSSGLLIWHIDESQGYPENDNDNYPGCGGCSGHYKVQLEQADNRWDLEKNLNRGDAGDPFPGVCGGSICQSSFTGTTAPNSNLWNGQSSGVTITNISAPNSIMTATISAASPTAPTLSISKTHSGNFTQGQHNAQYTLVVSNGANAAPTTGTVTVTETVPSGLSLVSMFGIGWACNGNTCTRNDVLNGGSSYFDITVMVDVAANATSPQINAASVSGGGSANANTTDSTTVIQLPFATQLIITTQPVGGLSGAALTTQPVIAVRNAQNNTVTTDNTTQVSVAIQSGAGGTLGGTTTVTAVNGIVAFTNLTLTGIVGNTYVLRFTSPTLTLADSNNVTVTASGAATRLGILTQPVGGSSGAALTTQPVIAIQDAGGNTVTTDNTTQVSVAIQSGAGGTLGGTTPVTAVNGIATFTNLTLAGVAGTNYVLRFTSAGLTSADSGTVNLTGGAITSAQTGNWNNGATWVGGNVPLSTDSVIINNAHTVTVNAASAIFNVTINSGGTLSFAGGSSLSINGNLTNTGTFNTTSGAVTFSPTSTATYNGGNQLFLTSITFNHLTISGTGTKAANGATTITVNGNFTVAAGILALSGSRDINVAGNTLINGGTLQLTGGGTKQFNNVTLSSGNWITGSATPTILGNVSITGGTWTVASSPSSPTTFRGNLSRTGGAFTSNAANPGPVVLAGLGSPAINGISAIERFTVNTSGSYTTDSDITVGNTLTLTSGALITGSNKVIIPLAGTVSRTGGYIAGNLQKNVPTGAAALTFEIGNGAYTPATIAFGNVSVAGTLTAGTTAGDHPNIAGSGLDASKSVNRYWSLTNAGGLAFNNYSATFTFVPADLDGGTNTSALSVGKYNGSWTLPSVGARTATSAQATGLTTFSDFIVAEPAGAAATKLGILTQPVGGASGAALATQPVIAIQDAGGSTITSDNTTQVSVAIQSGAGGTLGGTTTITAVNGIATFTNLTLTGVIGNNYVLRFTSTPTLTAVDSNSLTVAAGAATKLGILSQPVGGSSGAALTTQPVIAIQDAGGSTVTSDNTTQVTIAIQAGAGGTLGGTQTVTAVNGIVTFTNLTLAGIAGNNYVLRFTSTPALTLADSNNVNVAAGTAAKLGIATQPVGGSSGAALGTQPVIAIQDAQSNTVTTDNSTQVTVTIQSGAGATLGGPQTVTVVNGIATFTNVTLAGVVGNNYVLRFTSTPSLTLADSNNVNLAAGAATQLIITTQPVGGASGAVLGTQPLLAVRDASGNTVTTDNSTQVTVTIQSGAGGTLGGPTTVTALNGIVTFTNLTLAGTVGTNYVLRFGVAGDTLTAASSNNVTVTGTVSITSAQTGNWNNGATWVGGNVPLSTDSVIINNAHTVTVNTASSIFNVTINSGGTLSFAGGSSLSINGNLTNTGTFNTTSGAVTFSPTSTATYNGGNQLFLTSITFNHLTISGTGTKAANGATTITVNGNFTVAAGTLALSGSRDINVAGNTLINGGTLQLTGGGTKQFNNVTLSSGNWITGSATPTILGNLSITGGTWTVASSPSSPTTFHGNLFRTGGVFTSNTANPGPVVLAGLGSHTINGISAIERLTINTSGSYATNSDITVGSTLTLTSGTLITGSNRMIIPLVGTVSRTSGYIAGNLQKSVPTGATTRTFEIGDAAYAPVTIAFGTVSVAGTLTVSTTLGDHPVIAGSGLNATKSVNRYWTLTDAGGLAFNNFSVTFSFVPGDVDPGTATSNLAVGKYNGSWTLPSVGARTATSTQATGLTTFSDFIVAEP